MKKRELESKLKNLGWKLERHGGNHDIWGNGKGKQEPVPRHNEIAERLAKKILKTAQKNPG